MADWRFSTIVPSEVNSYAGSEFDLRAGIYYARLELTLTRKFNVRSSIGSARCIQHILDKNTVAPRWIIHKDVCDCSHNSAILQNG